ncbi:hypothetical protein CHS0354_036663 [Potamilus streckersoni]|uniref:NADH-cytochrome b5 reductase n=1 Tax=Potamilus streckersoni TaxID=2493646 RepID=A0AAE0WD65_9BIVA|nr:hypothetical protein CHS0354_036663 [Potamilus streckersoni]
MEGNCMNNVIDFEDNTLMKPVKPSERDCCRQGCSPCVFDIYEQELKIWEEECRKIVSGKESEKSKVTEGGPVLKQMEYSVFVVQSIKQETMDSYRVRIGLPPGATLGMTIGQHLIIRGMLDGELVTRQYTPITNVNQKSYFDLLIKVYPEGKMSRYVNTWQVGTKVEMRGPFGNFIYRPNEHRCLFMLAAGTGITPMAQVVQGILDNPDDETVIHLLYSCVTYTSVLLKPEIDEWGKFWNFSVLFCLSHEQDTGNYKYKYGERIHLGRLDLSRLQEEMGKFVDNCFVLICGTQSFEEDMIRHVTNLKVPKSNIFNF